MNDELFWQIVHGAKPPERAANPAPSQDTP
jgi:hypothetical protein